MTKDKDQSNSPIDPTSPDTVRLPVGWSDSDGSYKQDDFVANDELGLTDSTSKPGHSFDTLLLGESPVVEEVRAEKAAKKDREQKTLRNVLIAVLAVVVVTGIGFGALAGFNGYQTQQHTQKVEKEKKQQSVEKAKAIKEADSPYSVLVGKVDPPSEEPITAAVEGDDLKIGTSTLTITGATLTPTVNGCTLGAITDVCLGARGTLDKGDFDVFLIKDISRTRILDNPKEFAELKTAGDTIAASMAIDMGAKDGPTRVGALTSNGTTGFLLIFPAGTSTDRVNAVLKAATVI